MEEGVWVAYNDASLLIGCSSSPKYQNTQRQKINEVLLSKKGTLVRLTPEESNKIDLELAADFLLLDWKNITDSGDQLSCTREVKISVMTIFPVILQDVQRFANDLSLFRFKQVEAEAKALGEALPGQ